MDVSIEDRGSAVLVRVEDTQLGVDSAEQFRSKVSGAIQGHRARLAIDLSKVEVVDSSGLGALVSLLKTVRPSGDVVLFGLRPGVKEVLHVTHLDAVFACEANEAAALATFPQAS